MRRILLSVCLSVCGVNDWAAGQPPAGVSAVEAVKAAAEAADQFAGQIELQIVDPQGQPVSGAVIECRQNASDWKLLTGAVVQSKKYGTLIRADEAGRIALAYSAAAAKHIVFNITLDGFAPFWAEWDSSEHAVAIPERYVVHLSPGLAIGGVIVDEQGRPIAGAQVRPSVRYERREGDLGEIYSGASLTTAADGTWAYKTLPASMEIVSVDVNHPGYRPLTVEIGSRAYAVDADRPPRRTIVMSRGLTVTGRVTDEQGAPVVGALVRGKFRNDERQAKSDADGRYEMTGCSAGMTDIAASAAGYALEQQKTLIAANMPPVDFLLPPGQTIRVRVLDQEGKPVPKARIFFQRWRDGYAYFAFDHVPQYADANGVWEWRDAPADEFLADICPPEGMVLSQQRLQARAEEYVFRTAPLLRIAGRVIDAETRQPIASFHVLPGLRGDAGHMNWIPREAFDGRDGAFQLEYRHGYAGRLMKVAAEGYFEAVSRDVLPNEGRVELEFALRPGRDIAPAIFRPDGSPAVGAQVVLGVAESQIALKNGEFSRQTFAERRIADEQGRVRFPPRAETLQLFITHPAGCANQIVKPGETLESVELQPWCRVEGTLRQGAALAANTDVAISHYEGMGMGEGQPARVFFTYRSKTDDQGQFSFDRVVPGRGRIERQITFMVNEGQLQTGSARGEFFEFPAGQTVRADIGGTGRPVLGRLEAPPGVSNVAVLWPFVRLQALPQTPQPPLPAGMPQDAGQQAQWWQDWIKTPEGLIWQAEMRESERRREQQPAFSISPERDGRFRIDDVPAGAYRITSTVSLPPGLAELNQRRLSWQQAVLIVPEIPGGRTDEPLELGVISFQQP